MSCAHNNFKGESEIITTRDRTGRGVAWFASLQIRCVDCGQRFKFVGPSSEASLTQPTVSASGLEVLLPLVPATGGTPSARAETEAILSAAYRKARALAAAPSPLAAKPATLPALAVRNCTTCAHATASEDEQVLCEAEDRDDAADATAGYLRAHALVGWPSRSAPPCPAWRAGWEEE